MMGQLLSMLLASAHLLLLMGARGQFSVAIRSFTQGLVASAFLNMQFCRPYFSLYDLFDGLLLYSFS